VLLAAIVSGTALSRGGDDDPTTHLTVGWGGSEGHPSCAYNPKAHTVTAKLTIDGEAARPQTVTMTVTAYADENTSRPVGSGSRSVQVDGTVHLPVLVTIQVEKAAHVDEDGETACTHSEKY
jgi:hypothetical protein